MDIGVFGTGQAVTNAQADRLIGRLVEHLQGVMSPWRRRSR